MKNISKNTNQYSSRYIDSVESYNEFESASQVIVCVAPDIPAYLYRSDSAKKNSAWFVDNFIDFSGKKDQKYNERVLFSVKSNPDERVIRDVAASGVKSFDVASISEVRRVSNLVGKDVRLYFMHSVKSLEAIKDSYFCYGVRDFSFDCESEVEKILDATKNAKDLNLHLRIAMSCRGSVVDLSEKFGIKLENSLKLAKKARMSAKKFGICFHVGSQCAYPEEYGDAIKNVSKFFEENKVEIDSFDVGGGFPSNYPGMKTRSMSEYLKQIKDAIKSTNFKKGCEILCEPGRAISAECESLLVRVEARKGDMLYINDGTYGGLFDAGILKFSYFCKAYDSKGKELSQKSNSNFGFYGPTCDSLDYMEGPFSLPGTIKVGDYIEIFNLGSYSKSIRSNFNGYGEVLQFDVCDQVEDVFCQVF